MTAIPPIFAGCFVALTLAICAPLAMAAETIIVFAAASLKNALDETAQRYAKESSNKVTVSYAATPALARQIENGAPADIFISADQDWMNYLSLRHLIKPESRRDLLKNSLVLIAPSASTVKVEILPNFPLAQLLRNDRLAMANPDSVPAGKYAKAALEALGVWPSVRARIAPAENVRAALTLVSRGEAPLGIVYKTDAFADKTVRIVAEFPVNTHPAIVYPAAVTTHSRSAAAAGFFEYLGSSTARKLFEKHGFW